MTIENSSPKSQEAHESHSDRSETPANSSAWEELVHEVPYAEDQPIESSEAVANHRELPTASPNHTCNFYLHEIERQGGMNKIKTFLKSTASREPLAFFSEAELNRFCTAYSERLSSAMTANDLAALKNYSGLNYKTINQVARGHWNYDSIGTKTPEKVAAAKQSIDQISHAISIAPSLGTDLTTYRGANIDSFQGYDINSLSDLTKLEGQFFLESGFTSTSLDPNQSFANRKFDDPLRQNCNIAVEYFIPAENHETIGLLSQATSYNPEQRELLIDKNSLSYISNVKINPDQNNAQLEMILIPRNIYDPAYSQE